VTEAGEIGRLPNANGLGLNDAGELLAVGMDGRLMQLVPGAPIPAPVAWAMSGSPVEGEPALDETSLRAVAGRAEPVERGRLIFASRGCPACHGARGEGALGPNLRDDHWLHGSRMTDIVRTIARGNPQAGMPAWAEVLSAAELHAVGAFVASLGGGSPMPGKAPQGKRDPISYPVYGRGAERRR
jgi:mono/diheme cytochrome c family protein